jgi:hypothetical protein
VIRIIFLSLANALLFICQILPAVYASSGDSINRVSLCDLVHNPERYEGRSVEVSATYQVGFECTEMYCLGCTDLGRIWVKFESDSVSKKIKVKEKQSIPGCTFDVIFSGRFYSAKKGYGHRGAYRYEFVVESVKKAKLIFDNTSDSSKWPIKAQKKVCGYENELGNEPGHPERQKNGSR